MKEDIISKIKKVLQHEGFRFTKQREAVWNELVNNKDHHDADQIYENIKLKTLSDYKHLLDEALLSGKISTEQAENLKLWRKDPSNWK